MKKEERKPTNSTQAQYLQLVGLLALATKHRKLVEDARDLAEKMVGDDQTGHICDVFWGDRELDDALRLLKITVRKR